MAQNNYDKGTVYAQSLEDFISGCRAGSQSMPLKADGSIHKTELAKRLGFKQRSTFAQNERCKELMIQAEKEFNSKSDVVECDGADSATVKQLEREVARLEKRLADVLVENAELRRNQNFMEIKEHHLIKTGWLVGNVID